MKKTKRLDRISSRPLGELELEVMKVLWKMGEATGKEVWKGVRGARQVAITTVLTVMERLMQKGLIEKTRTAGPFVYRPLLSSEEFTEEVSRKILRDYMAVSSTSLITAFLDILEDTDPEAMERLYRFIEEKRKEKAR